MLARAAVPGVLSVHADPAGALEVTFDAEPNADVVARVRELLSPITVVVVWYEGSASPLEFPDPPTA